MSTKTLVNMNSTAVHVTLVGAGMKIHHIMPPVSLYEVPVDREGLPLQVQQQTPTCLCTATQPPLL